MAAVLGAMLEAKPVQRMIRALAENAPPGEAGAGEPPQVLEQGKGGADPSEAEYQKLYAYNLGLTGDTAKVDAERAPDSPLQALLRGQSVKIDPAQLQAALALGMASAHRKPAPAPAKAATAPPSPRVLRYMFWIVIALSAGAMAAATLAFR